MLKSFFFRNCYSFLEEATLSACANPALKDNFNFTIPRGEGNNKIYLNPVVALYGSNAGGKTNVLRALEDAVKNVYLGQEIRNQPFLFKERTGDSDDVFMHKLVVVCAGRKGDMEYEYSYTSDTNTILTESLRVRELSGNKAFYEIFDRKGSYIYSSVYRVTDVEYSLLEKIALKEDLLVLKHAGEIGLPHFAPLYEWCGTVTISTQVWSNSGLETVLHEYAAELEGNESELERFGQFMSMFDPAIVGIKTVNGLSEGAGTNFEARNRSRFVTLYNGTKANGEPAIFPVSMNIESYGTKKFMELHKDIARSLKDGSLLVYPALDTFLHPLVLRKIVAMYNDKTINTKGAQLVFSAHNTVLLNRECLRRDEITFVGKEENGRSSMVRLSEVVDDDGNRIRMDATYDKLYLTGSLGAIPYAFLNASI